MARAGGPAPVGGGRGGVHARIVLHGAICDRVCHKQSALLARSAPGGGADGKAAHFLRLKSDSAFTADRYCGRMATFATHSCARGACALPASTAMEMRYVGWQWRRGTIMENTLNPMLAAVRKRHLGAGY